MNHYMDETKRYYHMQDGSESLVGDAAYFKGSAIVWYQTKEAVDRAMDLFNGVKLREYREILDFESEFTQKTVYSKKRQYLLEQFWDKEMLVQRVDTDQLKKYVEKFFINKDVKKS